MVRISGLASGMDIDSLVENLMKAERAPLDKLQQQKQKYEWQRDDYREISTMMFNLSNSIFDNILKQSTYTQKKVNISDSNLISVRNISSTSDFSGTIKVNSLATSSSVVGDSIGNSIDSSKKVSEIFTDVTGTQSIKVKAITAEGKLEEKEVTFDASKESLDDVIKKVNQQTGATMFFDSKTGQVSLTSKKTGTTNEVTNNMDFSLTGTLFEKLNVADNVTDKNKRTPGSNASFTYNGINTTRTSNIFQINGFEITLKEADSTKNVTFSSSTDVDAVVDKIVKFVDEYNKLVEKVNGKVTEKRYRDFPPLTSEQKKDMEDKEIELWEEKAKSGMLYNDTVLSSGLTEMRTNLYTPVSGLVGVNQLSQIGITTTKNYLDGGKLTIDEKKLREAIEKDPNAVYSLFTQDGETTGEKGLARRLRDSLKNTITNIEEKAGKSTSVNNTFTIGKLLDNVDKRIDSLQDRLYDIENRYYSQFSAMETAIQKANQQSAYLSQFFSS
ncbi:flagellar hook-associated protein 2 [Heyndrickxia vini]|uniref:Flagellar hook-associated protein 2 n=1 Tax=Heyndrickxia vini TaxID=1476025 RepID=A0ABX7E7K4_9BACI|nr:flagellar hook-associated protein 2 [Heyndrickxia vini]QQZ10282.1 flagellar hook-associated protein 2 [Heyndrickxia vini]